VRGVGPGGQHVNKVATALEVRWAVMTIGLPQVVLQRLLAQAGKRLVNGEVVLVGARFKSQLANRRDLLARLEAMLVRALAVPKPRRATKPTRASQERRVQGKKLRAAVKAGRGKGWE
jgi:ribosome-associated protein